MISHTISATPNSARILVSLTTASNRNEEFKAVRAPFNPAPTETPTVYA